MQQKYCNKYSKKDIEKAKNIILKVLNPEQIILFGSYATGKFNDKSDIDLMVLVEEEMTRKEKKKKLFSIRSLFFDWDLEVDLIINNLQHFNDYKNYIGSINYSVHREVKILWTKN